MTTRNDHGPSTHREDRDGTAGMRTLAARLMFETPARDVDDAILEYCWRGEGSYHTSQDAAELAIALQRAMTTLGSIAIAYGNERRAGRML